MGCRVWRRTLQPPYLVGMVNNGKPQPLAAIIGERMKQFRAEKGLRQSDISAAAAQCGLSWGRSSVAAIEAGTRNLSLREFFMLPWVIVSAGGWDKPFLPSDTSVALDSTQTTIGGMAMSLTMLQEPMGGFGSPAPPKIQKILNEETAKPRDPVVDLEASRLVAEDIAWRCVCAFAYPHVDYDAAGRQAAVELELTSKVANRLKLPDGRVADWRSVMVFSWGRWGHSIGTERDMRAASKNYATRRALQSARGHITRELISELEREARLRWPLVERVFDEVRAIWNDAQALVRWYQKAYRLANETIAKREVNLSWDEVLNEALPALSRLSNEDYDTGKRSEEERLPDQ